MESKGSQDEAKNFLCHIGDGSSSSSSRNKDDSFNKIWDLWWNNNRTIIIIVDF